MFVSLVLIGDCDFEYSTCQWQSANITGEVKGLDWSRTQGGNTNETSPAIDHTRKSKLARNLVLYWLRQLLMDTT